ncbi:phosphonate ABC transporter, permease protein PhnE [Natrinema thermotolerans]|uniref:Phosphonate ABC transporter, permease protein PhnE n=1 Tax=Natrinema thermotolerans TaxID=121872 RepID=A0AAF0PEL2_9EURY|nr:phosphonate ABC transporter, permease protein PhnE [Natrinema thermotolerans]QCC60405.1 phosphonate ABC transporter, permease protein PhnE [Natrinema thermotolerans]QCC61312.1 phosphonate ABC transporter, permease protein PhnE [Natrinema thermotolerans]WMT07432.1 phosphonate ABC transporter, permease protein PhnE [Natrinema thermotolerans]WMT08064.1 phosphonate ABC transporter, permease protein PhnE [Natrinema thermotolerans]
MTDRGPADRGDAVEPATAAERTARTEPTEESAGNAPSSNSVAAEFDRVQRQWRRRTAGRAALLVALVAGVVAIAQWLGFDLAYLYAHRENLVSILLEEMLAPDRLAAQLRADGPSLAAAALETLAIAAVGTAIGLPPALCVGVLAASNVAPRVVYGPARLLLGGLRAVPSMVYALLFVVLAGLGPVAGTLAIAMGTVGDLGRLFADEMEEIDPGPVDALRSTGAGIVATTAAARLPQVTTAYVAWTLFYLELNARKSSVLGIVGAGGIGYPLIMAFRARNYTRVMAAIVVVLALIVGVETVANALRSVLDADRRAAER